MFAYPRLLLKLTHAAKSRFVPQADELHCNKRLPSIDERDERSRATSNLTRSLRSAFFDPSQCKVRCPEHKLLAGQHRILKYGGGLMRKLLIAATLAVGSSAARADSLPSEFLGWWCLDQYNSFQITPQSISGGGADCRLTSIKAEHHDNNLQTYIVGMTCALAGTTAHAACERCGRCIISEQ